MKGENLKRGEGIPTRGGGLKEKEKLEKEAVAD